MVNGAGDTMRQQRAQKCIVALLEAQKKEVWENETIWFTLRDLARFMGIKPSAYAQSIVAGLCHAHLLMKRQGRAKHGAMRWQYAIYQARIVQGIAENG